MSCLLVFVGGKRVRNLVCMSVRRPFTDEEEIKLRWPRNVCLLSALLPILLLFIYCPREKENCKHDAT